MTTMPGAGTPGAIQKGIDLNSAIVQESGSPFESIRRVRPDGSEFWSARELMPLMGCDRWENFAQSIDRARIACAFTGQSAVDLFRGVTKKAGGRPAEDFELSRLAAYLVAMNGDPRKPEVAAAQSYFAIQTRKQELAQPTPALASRRDLALAVLAAEEELSEARAELSIASPKAAAWDQVEACAITELRVSPTARAIASISPSVAGGVSCLRMIPRRLVDIPARAAIALRPISDLLAASSSTSATA